jgi:hypothetical protein
MPPGYEDTKLHKELIFNDLGLMCLCAFVPLRLCVFVAKKKLQSIN